VGIDHELVDHARSLLPAAVMPQGPLVDYEPCIVATVPPDGSLQAAFRAAGQHVAPGQPLRQLEAEVPAAAAARWAHTPRDVLERQPPWLV
jgi:hypothetical protein